MTPKAAKKLVESEFSRLVDELGALEQLMAPHAQKLARIDMIRKTLREACPAAPDAEWTVDGERFSTVLGMRANASVISFSGVVKAIGAAAYAKFATCTLKALEEHVAPGVRANVISSERSGPRTIKTFERGKAC